MYGQQTGREVATYIPRGIKTASLLFLSWTFKLDPEKEKALEIKLRTFLGY